MLTLSAAEARRHGFTPKARPRDRRSKVAKASPQLFIAACLARELPAPVPEFRFAAPERQWRFDWYWPEHRISLEVQGGLFLPGGGRHSRGAALRGEHDKLNAAAILGIRVLFCLPEDIDSGAIFPVIEKALATASPCR